MYCASGPAPQGVYVNFAAGVGEGGKGVVWMITLKFWGDPPKVRRNAFVGTE